MCVEWCGLEALRKKREEPEKGRTKGVSTALEVGSGLACLSNQGKPRMVGAQDERSKRHRPGKTDLQECQGRPSVVLTTADTYTFFFFKQKRREPQGVPSFQIQFFGFL